uniref:Uncharacterized protein n=1 Tax=Oryza brachyantha TaxID=4533 RepID=J3NAC3_ORYBR
MLAEIIELSSPNNSLAMPKSATCAVMSSSNRTLLGFKSQCRTTSWCSWCRYSIAIDTSSIICNLSRRPNCILSSECRSASKLPFGMY